MAKHCAHGTLLHFSLQDSHLNTRYYHQDLHWRPFQTSSRPSFDNMDPHAHLLGPQTNGSPAEYRRYRARRLCPIVGLTESLGLEREYCGDYDQNRAHRIPLPSTQRDMVV